MIKVNHNRSDRLQRLYDLKIQQIKTSKLEKNSFRALIMQAEADAISQHLKASLAS